MINSLFSQNSSALVQHYNPMQNSGINAQKMDAVKSVLANYDASNISTSDAKEIATQIKDIGIAPGRTLAIVFAGEGFNAASIGNQAGVEGQRPPPPPGQGGPKGEINTEAVAALKLLVESKNGEAVTETEWTSFYEDLESKGVDTSRPFIDLKL